MKASSHIEKLLKDNNLGIRVDLGCGSNKQPGFVGIDIRPLPGVDIVQDLEQFPWPLPDESVSFMVSSHVVEHINPARGIFLKFMDECWRILKPGGKFLIATPYAGSQGYFMDPTHCNPCNEMTWAYFDPLDRSNLYRIYEPAPWKILESSFNVNGNMEVALIKRLDDPSYHSDSKKHYV